MAAADAPLAIMGGAFDPVHMGHLRTAVEIREACGLGEIRLVPSANPPHRPPHIAPAETRIAMLRAATSDLPWCSIDDRELHRDGPSYSVLTLNELRDIAQQRSLCMILGMDAFLSLGSWHRWEEIPALAHIIVAHRPGWQPPQTGQLGDFIGRHLTTDADDLRREAAGRVYIHEVTQLEISSSAIRDMLMAGESPRYLMPDAALDIALDTGCYAD